MVRTSQPLQIVDAHHHLWDLEQIEYPWLMARGVQRFFGDPTAIQKNYLPSDFRLDIGHLPITQSVHIQVGVAENKHMEETQWLQKTSEQQGLPSAIVAFCDLSKPNVQEELEQLQSFSVVRGIRQIVGRSMDEDQKTGSANLLENANWHRGLEKLRSHQLSFDLQLIPEQMKAMSQILRANDELPVALCHCGSPWYRDRDGWALWLKGLKMLAEMPQVYCKISGLSMFDHKWTIESLKPVVYNVLDIFGVERCMFGSNFPVDKLHCNYQQLWKAYFTLTEGFSESERQLLFATNSQHFYKI